MAENIETSPTSLRSPGLGIARSWPAIAALAVAAAGFIYSVSSSSAIAAILFAAVALTAAVCLFAMRSMARKLAIQTEGDLHWRPALPDVQRQNLSIEVKHLAGILDVEPEQVADLQSAYIVAEDLALRQIQQEEKVPVLRQVTVEGVPFDAVLVKEDLVICCHLSFLITPEIDDERLAAVMRRVGSVHRSFEGSGSRRRVRLMLILITQLTPEDEARLRPQLNAAKFKECPVEVDIRLLDFEALQRIYVTDK